MPQPLPRTPGSSTELNGLQTSATESGSEISDMVRSHELGIEVESLEHESNPDPSVLPECDHRFNLNICILSKPDTFVIAFISAQPPSSQKPNFKSYEKENTFECCAPTEDAGQDDIIFSGEVEIIFVSNISQTIPRLEKIQNDSKTCYYPKETEAFFNNNIWNPKLMKESARPPHNLPKSEHTFFKMVQSLLYPPNPLKHSWANVMFESIGLVSYNVIAPKPYVAPTSNLTNPLGFKWRAVEYLASFLSKSKQHETQLSIEGGGADNELLTKPHKNLGDLMDTVIHLMIKYKGQSQWN
ncbi:hypothetical protein O181_014813 [Austropuccinia psidii MF-1]|uniref:Uncharacterized protein n=1 Tax=Austropuccinia psidii MF-1 TaxID=1389203 RepID=A0A9Q3C198_9BASI|nr:hypothetical protein [Austropuccinia psidii MF-1]